MTKVRYSACERTAQLIGEAINQMDDPHPSVVVGTLASVLVSYGNALAKSFLMDQEDTTSLKRAELLTQEMEEAFSGNPPAWLEPVLEGVTRDLDKTVFAASSYQLRLFSGREEA